VALLAAIVGLALFLKREKPEKPEKPEQPEQLPPTHPDTPVSLLFVAGHGYRLLEIEPRALTAGSVLDVEGQTHVVARLGPAPLPADGRRCAYVEPSGGRSSESGESS
jgi:hypothetical protein